MNEFDYDTSGAPVVFSSVPEIPYNPLRRPKVSFVKPVIALMIYLLFSIATFEVTMHCLNNKYATLCFVIWTLIYLSVIAKKTVVWMIHLYQRYAPDKVRLKCVFTPSCSEYMIAAIEKYGLIKGVYKGINRLFRCHHPNGGIDYP